MKKHWSIVLAVFLIAVSAWMLFVYPNTKAGAMQFFRTNESAMQEHAIICMGEPNTVWPFRGWDAGYSEDWGVSWFQVRYMGFGSEYKETGFYYSATDVPSGIGNDLQQERMEGGIKFLGEGDNYTYVEKLKDHWYWYERHW